MDVARGRRGRRTRRPAPIIPALDSVQFSQWTFIDLPDRYDGFFGYLDYFMIDCQSYFSSLFDPKPKERQWIKFMMSRFFGPGHNWAQRVAAMRPRVLEDSRQFSDLFLSEFGEPGQSYNLDELFKGVNVANSADLPFPMHYERMSHQVDNTDNQARCTPKPINQVLFTLKPADPVDQVRITSKPPDPVDQVMLMSKPADQVMLMSKPADQVQPTPESADPVAQVQPTPESADTTAQVQPKPESANTHSQVLFTPESTDTATCRGA